MSNIAKLDEALDRVLTQMRTRGAGPVSVPNVSCVRCDDRGVILLTSGQVRTWGSTARGEGRVVDARITPTAVGCSCRASTSTVKRREF